MDVAFYWISGVAISAFAAVFWWVITESKREATKRLNEDLERLGASKEQLEKINEVQSSPFTDSARANAWLQKYRNKTD